MGRQPRYGERSPRLSLRRLRTRSSNATDAPASRPATARSPRAAKLTRFGLRALLVAGAASAAWFLGTQAASAAPASTDAAPRSGSQAGLIGTTTHALGSLTEALSGSGGGCAAGTSCERPSAATRDGSARQDSAGAPQARPADRSAPVANAADAAHGAAPVSSVPAGGANAAGTTPVRTAGTGDSGQRPGLGTVLDVTRPVTGALDTETSPITSEPSQRPVIDVLTGVLHPVAATVTDSARPVTGVLADPLVDTTRPVTGLLTTVARPLPGTPGAVVAPLTGVLTGDTGSLPGMAAPHGAADPAHPYGGWTDAARQAPSWAGDPFATWTGTASFTGRTGTSVPTYPEPTPLAYPGSGLAGGGTASSAGGHAGVGACALAGYPIVPADSASRMAPGTAQPDLPRLHEVDPVISPD